MELSTIEKWVADAGWTSETATENTLRVLKPNVDIPLFVRPTEHWLMLQINKVVMPGVRRPNDFSRRLLAVNRDLNLAKLGIDNDGDVVLAAELMLDGLEPDDFLDAAERMIRYVKHYGPYLLGYPTGS